MSRAQLSRSNPYTEGTTTPAARLRQLETQYTILTSQYGPNHPDVIKARHQIEALRLQVPNKGTSTQTLQAQIDKVTMDLEESEQIGSPNNPDIAPLKNQLKKLEDSLRLSKTNSTAGIVKRDADNPAYLSLEAQIQSDEDQHKSLLAQRETLKTEQRGYQEAIATNPALEQQMAVLSRDYDNSQLR
jgi:uncharacterized protein involved in exopolysaccharide biosynthesis